LSFPNIRWLLALITAPHRFVYQKSGGLIGGRLPGGKRFLLLTTVGRKTGMRRVMPLLYVPVDDRIVVVASNAGDDRAPAWWLNLESQPRARIQVGTEEREVSARRAEGDELAALWPRLDASYPPYAQYRERTPREIPVVVLESGAGRDAGSRG
jgi:deazaflavin-dependent oxidoreductase (nitroreductase family)